MAENQPPLQSTLADLQRQLTETRELTPELRASLAALVVDIQRTLSASAAGGAATSALPVKAGQHDSLVARLSEAAREFEDTHPTLSGTIGSIIDALAGMGI